MISRQACRLIGKILASGKRALMPKGTRHIVTGRLDQSARGYVLRVDGGGVWTLDPDRVLHSWLGKRVTIDGQRTGFDFLSVEHIAAADSIEPSFQAKNRCPT